MESDADDKEKDVFQKRFGMTEMGLKTCTVAGILGACLCTVVQAEPLKGLTITPTADSNHFKYEYKYDESKEPITGFFAFPKGIGPFRVVIVNHSPIGNAKQAAYNYAPKFVDRGYAGITLELNYAAKAEESDWTDINRRLSACMEILQHDDRFDAKQIFMYGNGAGAMVTLSYAALTDKLRAIALTGGGMLPKDGVNFEKVSAPVILVHGEKDQIVPLDAAMKLKANLERAKKTVELKVVTQGGHEVITLQSGEVYDAIVAFFNKYSK